MRACSLALLCALIGCGSKASSDPDAPAIGSDGPRADGAAPTTPSQQLNIYDGPVNAASADYAQLMAILSAPASRAFFTGVTTTLPLGCSGTCTGATATYLDHVGAGLASTGCPDLVFGGADGIDALLTTIAGAGYTNNLILDSAGYAFNSLTPAYLASQEWADNLDLDCMTRDSSLTWAPNHPYLPGDYIVQGSVYWQMTASCPAANGNDVHCASSAAIPHCLTTPSSPCSDGAAIWTETPDGGLHAPPLDYWCDANSSGKTQLDCYQLQLNGNASITGSVAKVTVANPPTFPIGLKVTVTGAGAPYDCTGCAVTASSATTVSYAVATPSSPIVDLMAGTIAGAHALSIATPNATTAILSLQLPVPWEQPIRVWRKYVFAQLAAHYAAAGNPALGYVRLGMTKGGESDTSGIAGWPNGSQNQMLSYEQEMYAFMGSHGCGTTFACVGNLHTYPTQEASYMSPNNIGLDNNALGVDQVAAILGGGCKTAGALPNGGDWCLEFSQAATLPDGKPPILTLQTGGATEFSSPGMCGSGDVGAMSADPTCTTAPFTGGYPGNLPIAYQYGATNSEMYFCDVMLALAPAADYASSSCKPQYSQTMYGQAYQDAFKAFLTAR